MIHSVVLKAELPMRTRIKLCGLKQMDDVVLADRLGADAIGLVFYPPSPRAISAVDAAPLATIAGAFCTRVGLFVNPSVDDVEAVLARVPLDVLQFHGDETPDFCASFGRAWMKALRVRNAQQLAADLETYNGANSLLLDAYKPGEPGGTGETFNWNLIPERWRSRIILAGGLTPANVAQAVQQVQPLGVDVSGGIEASKGIKSAEKMTEFVRQVRLADSQRDIA
ncbi:phosphoribosylanthranilate isomerase [Saccharospirillum sp. MSK14-1]|uniref:phosphoribosylanthranilate isomerase n=1 Tax=Saccharospirillum sp. MSK14-1 TaxID=1897632 RepID=UPI003519F754